MDAPVPFEEGQSVGAEFLNQNVTDKIVELQRFNSTVLVSAAKPASTLIPSATTWQRIDGLTVTRSLGASWTTGTTTDRLKIPVTGWYATTLKAAFPIGTANSRRILCIAGFAAGNIPGPTVLRCDALVGTADDVVLTTSGEFFATAGTDLSAWAFSNGATGRSISQVEWNLRLVSPDVTA